MLDPLSYFSFHCSTTGLTMVMVCAILSGMVHIKEPLLLIEKSSPCSGGSGFPLSHYLSGPLPHLMPYNSIKCVECIVKSKCPIIKFECIYIQ